MALPRITLIKHVRDRLTGLGLCLALFLTGLSAGFAHPNALGLQDQSVATYLAGGGDLADLCGGRSGEDSASSHCTFCFGPVSPILALPSALIHHTFDQRLLWGVVSTSLPRSERGAAIYSARAPPRG